jgi:hypothetical protein
MLARDDRTVRNCLHRRRFAIMARYPIWDDAWVRHLTDEDARQLLAIFEALRRVQFGTYGLCVNCGSAIDLDRLIALPEAAACVVCAQFEAAPHACAGH